jgi:hypothetical protein
MMQSIWHCIILCDLYYVIWSVVWQFLNFVFTLFIGLFCNNLVCHLHVCGVLEHSRIFLTTWHFVFHSYHPLWFLSCLSVSRDRHVRSRRHFELLNLYIVTLAVGERISYRVEVCSTRSPKFGATQNWNYSENVIVGLSFHRN